MKIPADQERLARRDVRPPSDQIKIIIDSYFDRRSGYEFAVSPSGVKRDYIIYNDNQEDGAWDAVWDVSTSVDSLGWTAEFKIPLSQLRYANAPTHTFGFGVWRDIDRHRERVSWPEFKETQTGISSQLGELSGISGLSSPRRFEMAPYAVTKNVTVAEGGGFGHEQQFTAGADFKYGVSSNMTLGDRESDFGGWPTPRCSTWGVRDLLGSAGPSSWRAWDSSLEINRSAVNDAAVRTCSIRAASAGPPAHRLLRDATPALRPPSSALASCRADCPAALGRRAGRGHQREAGRESNHRARLNYAVVRVSKDLRNGRPVSAPSGPSESQSRRVDRRTASFKCDGGWTDFRHRSQQAVPDPGSSGRGQVNGSAEAMDLTQSAVHAFQRPDADLGYDPTRTSLSGDFEQVSFGKVSGNLFRFETSYQRTSPGFEINDLGFLNRADKQNQSTWANFSFNKPAAFYRRLYWNLNQWNDWTVDGLPLDRAFNTNVHTELKNSWWFNAGGTIGGLGEMYCDRCARGGPAVRTDEAYSVWSGISGDDRKTFIPEFWVNYSNRDGGRSSYFSVSPL
jgi:hypothetical protein